MTSPCRDSNFNNYLMHVILCIYNSHIIHYLCIHTIKTNKFNGNDIFEISGTSLLSHTKCYYESMVSLVLRHYLRGENGTESLVGFFSVMLIRIGKQNVKIIEK